MGKRLPKIITKEEFEQLFKAVELKHRNASSKRKPIIKQYMLAMLLGFEAGLRISEIVGWKDRVPKLQKLNIESSSIRILSGKGGKDRVTLKPKRLNSNAIKMLPLTISRRALQSFFKELARKVLNKNINFHTLRSGWATHLINSGRPLHEVQMLGGWSRLDTVGIYLRASPQSAIKGAQDVF